MSSSDISFIRWLEQNNMGDYISTLSDLGITSISHLLSLSHPQIIEVGRQLGCGHMRQVLFAESVVNHTQYANKHTINESILSDSIKLAYKLLNLLKKLAIMGPRDNWDNVTEEIYALIDETKNLRELIALIEESLKIESDNYVAWDLNGLINARRGFLADARVAFQRALVQNPNYLNARFNHARLLHYELREYQPAKSEYGCIIRIKPNFSRAYNSFAKLMEKMGDIDVCTMRYCVHLQSTKTLLFSWQKSIFFERFNYALNQYHIDTVWPIFCHHNRDTLKCSKFIKRQWNSSPKAQLCVSIMHLLWSNVNI